MLNQKPVAIVTGGSRGIGREISKKLADNGNVVYVNYHQNSGAAQETVAEIQERGGQAYPIQGSVSNPEDVQGIVQEIMTRHGKIDVLINNAGITRDGLLLMMKESDWKDVININLVGTLLFTKFVLKPMVKAGSGAIINIGSVGGLIGTPGQTNYAASKAGIIAFTKSLAKEVAPKKIRVNAIAAGYVRTDMVNNMGAERLERIQEGIPFRRFATPEEIASHVLYLLDDKSGYITGQTIMIDGGLTII